jgi:hypothetical protein
MIANRLMSRAVLMSLTFMSLVTSVSAQESTLTPELLSNCWLWILEKERL